MADKIFMKEVSYVHQDCIYLIKKYCIVKYFYNLQRLAVP